jgi:protein-tyrosine phosphatase
MKKILSIFVCICPLMASAQLKDSTTRLVRMEGAYNFRDAGGYPAANGKNVVTGRVFRSADISKLTDHDMETMKQKHIYTVIDFRGTQEAAKAPDRALPGTSYLLCPAGSDSLPNQQQMTALIKQGGFLEKMYGSSSLKHFGARYRPLFQTLLVLPDTSALLFHCTGGRDRTGMANALFLYSLGVPQDLIEQDFVASNVYLRPMLERMFSGLSAASGLDPEQVKKEMELRPELIRTFFASISKEYGSVEQFMDKELGLGKNELKALRAKYTN